MKKKIIRRNTENLDVSFGEHDFHPLLKRIYLNRGIKSNTELDRNLERLLPYQLLLNIDKAASCLAEALFAQDKFLIIGDFDADGATSTAVAVRALKSFGAKNVNYLVPNRFAFGYGLTPELVNVAKDLNPGVIVTVDNGISNHDGVLAAKNLGIKVVITDHHLAAETLPAADAIVNPNQANDNFPSKSIAGVGVIFYVMLALRRYLVEKNWFLEQGIPEPNMSKLLDIVALGTVADVVSLDQNNRIMVFQGLRRIRAAQCIPGITALLEISGRVQSKIVASDLGFSVAPRLNAAGRLDDMALGIECLLTDDLVKAREMAQVLNQLNDERRIIEQEMKEQAFEALNSLNSIFEKTLPKGICLFDETWHQGVIGILASRIKDKFYRPVFAFARSNENELKGSGRSIKGFHLRDALATIACTHPGLITRFGGHSMAAGLSINPQSFHEFSSIFNELVTKQLSEDDLNHHVISDGELEINEMTIQTAEIIREAGPWGQAFPEPLFDGTFSLIDQRLIGGKHLKLILEKNNQIFEAIAFNIDLNQWPNYRCEKINLAFRMDINEYKGKRSIQLVVEHLETV